MAPAFAAFEESEHRDRLARARKALKAAGFDLCISMAPEHLYYLAGYDSWVGVNSPQALIFSVADSDAPTIVLRNADIARANEYAETADEVAIARTDAGLDAVTSLKRLADGSVLLVEEVRTGRRALTLADMWKWAPGRGPARMADVRGRAAGGGGIPAKEGSLSKQDTAGAFSSSITPAPTSRPAISNIGLQDAARNADPAIPSREDQRTIDQVGDRTAVAAQPKVETTADRIAELEIY